LGASSWLDLDVRARALFAAAYVALQAGLVLSSPLRPDGVFSFQMFNESSTIAIRLSRRVATAGGADRMVPIDGSWEARDERGVTHPFHWTDRIRDPILSTLGRTVHASYGVDAQLFRLQKALDDVAAHLPGDAETRALVADVEVRRNGREPSVVRLESARRFE
jgi:hypothetical protein